MDTYTYEQLITEGIKGLPAELLREVADLVYLLRRRLQDPDRFAEEQHAFLLAAQLTQLGRDEQRHLEEEFAEYEQRFPRQ